MTFPYITMVGTRSFFYQIPVTQQLSDCIVVNFPLSQQSLDIVLRPPDEGPLKA